MLTSMLRPQQAHLLACASGKPRGPAGRGHGKAQSAWARLERGAGLSAESWDQGKHGARRKYLVHQALYWDPAADLREVAGRQMHQQMYSEVSSPARALWVDPWVCGRGRTEVLQQKGAPPNADAPPIGKGSAVCMGSIPSQTEAAPTCSCACASCYLLPHSVRPPQLLCYPSGSAADDEHLSRRSTKWGKLCFSLSESE